MAHDLVRDMEARAADASLTVAYKGSMFRFCGTPCKDKFVKEPEKYTDWAARSSSGCCCGETSP